MNVVLQSVNVVLQSVNVVLQGADVRFHLAQFPRQKVESAGRLGGELREQGGKLDQLLAEEAFA